MAPVSTAERALSPEHSAPAPYPNRADPNAPSGARPTSPARSALGRNASDDEILGLGNASTNSTNPALDDQLAFDFDALPPKETDAEARPDPAQRRSALRADDDAIRDAHPGANAEPENLRAVFDANPELRRDWQDANAFREAFATPEDARAATGLLADLDRMDSLFFSKRAEDHAELARSIASLDPGAFASLAQAMAAQAMAAVGAQSPSHSAAPAATPLAANPPVGTASVGAQHGTAALTTSAVPGADSWRRADHQAGAPPDLGRHSEERRDVAPSSRSPLRDEQSLFVSPGGLRSQSKRDPSSLMRLAPQDDGALGESVARNGVASPSTPGGHSRAVSLRTSADPAAPTLAQTNFFHATNAAAVETVIDAIEAQVERLLPDGVSKNARNRVVGEIYRELDGTLRSNRQLTQQMREAFRSGSLDADHQRAIVSLIAGRARQALPGVAKRVLNEWTSTVVAANQDRRARQRAAERRVDIAGSSGGGRESHCPASPRDIDYARRPDADILNL